MITRSGWEWSLFGFLSPLKLLFSHWTMIKNFHLKTSANENLFFLSRSLVKSGFVVRHIIYCLPSLTKQKLMRGNFLLKNFFDYAYLLSISYWWSKTFRLKVFFEIIRSFNDLNEVSRIIFCLIVCPHCVKSLDSSVKQKTYKMTKYLIFKLCVSILLGKNVLRCDNRFFNRRHWLWCFKSIIEFNLARPLFQQSLFVDCNSLIHMLSNFF